VASKTKAAHLREWSRLLEAEPRIARKQRGGVAIAQAANEIGFDVGAGEELEVDSGMIESGHGTTIQSKCARCDYQIGPLLRTVSKSRDLRELRLLKNPFHQFYSRRKELR
jgi:hypothetical protein